MYRTENSMQQLLALHSMVESTLYNVFGPVTLFKIVPYTILYIYMHLYIHTNNTSRG